MSENPESVLTPELLACIGQTTPRVPVEEIMAKDVRRFVDATGDANPLWLDDQFARSMGYPGRLLPPSLVGWSTFRSGDPYADEEAVARRGLPMPPGYLNVRNAGSETEWLRPVHLGEDLFRESQVVDITAREGRFGIGIYVTREERILDAQGEVVSRRRHVGATFREMATAQAQAIQED